MKDSNRRKAKSNSNYYMLKHTECPLVIVECGYLSDYNEANLLTDRRLSRIKWLGQYIWYYAVHQ